MLYFWYGLALFLALLGFALCLVWLRFVPVGFASGLAMVGFVTGLTFGLAWFSSPVFLGVALFLVWFALDWFGFVLGQALFFRWLCLALTVAWLGLILGSA